MKIGVISDTHVPRRGYKVPQEVLDAFKNVDLIIHAGDIEDEVVLDQLSELAEVRAVCGNMDPRKLSKKLPKTDILEVEGHHIGIVHGRGAPQGLEKKVLKKFSDVDVDAIVYGHSHQSRNEVIDGILFFNPGSPTDKVFTKVNSYGILHVDDHGIRGEIITL